MPLSDLQERMERAAERQADSEKLEARRAHDRHDALTAQSIEGAIAFGRVGIRTTLIINGGAAIAVLAFIGQIVGHHSPASNAAVSAISGTMLWFVAGIVASVLSYAAGYFALYFTAHHLHAYTKQWEHPWVVEGKEWFRVAGTVGEWGAFLLAVASLACFITGIVRANDAIKALIAVG